MILASNNKGKIEEVKKIFQGYEVYSLKDKDIDIEVVEDENTFEGNATKKAKEIYAITGEETIADDSGLCINCLNGFPGVITHRFLGDDATDRMRNEYLINEVNKHKDRSAQFICDIVYYDGVKTVVGEGIINGSIAKECRGDNGFGFDEIFELPNGLTLAELSTEEKNNISARSKALKVLKRKLNI